MSPMLVVLVVLHADVGVRLHVPIAGLPAALQGFTIAQITDMNIGPTIRRDFVDAVVDAVNRIGADMIAITGDLVDGSVRQLSPHTQPLSRLSARHLRLLLAHQPRSAFAEASAGFDLQLSGHTHGGGFVPWNFFVRFQQPFTAGLRRLVACGSTRAGAPATGVRRRVFSRPPGSRACGSCAHSGVQTYWPRSQSR